MDREIHRRTVLIAATTHTIGILISKVIKRYMHATTCLIYTSGVDVLDSVAHVHIDLLITEEWLNDMDAYDLSQAVKGARPQLPIILLTPLTSPEIEKALEDGLFDGILLKPFRAAELANATSSAIAISA